MTEVLEDASFEALLEHVRHTRGLDFTGYKRPSLTRRFRRRLDTVGCASFGDYLDYLEVNPTEYDALYETLLINVTEFFRDGQAWEHLREEALPRMLAGKGEDEPIRVWSAGCAGGQEAYTAAIVLAELIGEDRYRDRVKIYATDIDEDALSQARLAIYTTKECESVPSELRERYFEHADQRLEFRRDLRGSVIVGRNNLVQDAPISRLDLLICRNTLMYFNAETQARILRRFHFALNDTGVLMLGKSETMISHRERFAATDPRKRIFVKRPKASTGSSEGTFAASDAGTRPEGEDERARRDAALELGPLARVIVSPTGQLTFANLPARALFELSRDDLGRDLAALALSRRPVELADAVEQALRERSRIRLGQAILPSDRGEPRHFDVDVMPLLTRENRAVGVSVTFEDVTRRAALQLELGGSRRDLDLAYEELQATIHELETTNEELRTANEELQTTNEELETMNEEIQSTNAELETINHELRGRDRARSRSEPARGGED